MEKNVATNDIDCRHQQNRLRLLFREQDVLRNMFQHGLGEALIGVIKDDKYILFDGFKRLRAAKSLTLPSVPFKSLGSDEAEGIIAFIKICIRDNIHILEQAAFVNYLATEHHLSLSEIAERCERSKSWVSLRRSLLAEISPTVRTKIFAGDFSAYAYLHFIRPFMRVNEVNSQEVDQFVTATAGKKLSTRETELLAHGYFKGPIEIKAHIDSGDILWALKKSHKLFAGTTNFSESENQVIKNLRYLIGNMRTLIIMLPQDDKLKNNAFLAEANILAGQISHDIPLFQKTLGEFYDRSRNP
jgi:predicted transcriptional regulator